MSAAAGVGGGGGGEGGAAAGAGKDPCTGYTEIGYEYRSTEYKSPPSQSYLCDNIFVKSPGMFPFQLVTSQNIICVHLLFKLLTASANYPVLKDRTVVHTYMCFMLR